GAPLKLDVQHQCTAIGQGDVEYLVRGQRLGRQFDIERVGVAHVSLEQPGCKVGDEGTDQLFQWTIGVGDSSCLLAHVCHQCSTRWRKCREDVAGEPPQP